MKPLLAILAPIAYIWLAFYVGAEVLPEGWAKVYEGTARWWTVPAFITFIVTGILSLVPLMLLDMTSSSYDEYP